MHYYILHVVYANKKTFLSAYAINTHWHYKGYNQIPMYYNTKIDLKNSSVLFS